MWGRHSPEGTSYCPGFESCTQLRTTSRLTNLKVGLVYTIQFVLYILTGFEFVNYQNIPSFGSVVFVLVSVNRWWNKSSPVLPKMESQQFCWGQFCLISTMFQTSPNSYQIIRLRLWENSLIWSHWYWHPDRYFLLLINFGFNNMTPLIDLTYRQTFYSRQRNGLKRRPKIAVLSKCINFELIFGQFCSRNLSLSKGSLNGDFVLLAFFLLRIKQPILGQKMMESNKQTKM